MKRINKQIITTTALITLTIITGFIITSFPAYADDTAVDDVSINVPISCSLEGTGMNSHNASVVNGTYQADIGTTTMKAFCNDTNGFAIYTIGYTDNEYGKNVLTNSTLGSSADIATGTATSGSTSNWAMKLATNSGATYALTLDNGFNAYSAVPSTYTKVVHRDSGTDIGTNATGATLTSTYAAFMSQTQAAGTYSGKVIYTLVHPSSEVPPHEIACEAGKICYNANTNQIEGQMGKQTASNNNIRLPLWPPNFKRQGYGFAGWNTAYDYSGTTYGPQETITTPADTSTNGLSLYAVWVPSAGTLQNWSGCSVLTQGTVTALTDARDNNTYAVAKLADGKCWMIENLRLDNIPELSNANTHNPSLPFTNDYANSVTSNHLSPAIDPTQTAWCASNSSACDDQSMLATNNTTLFTNNTSSNYSASGNVYSYGNYYNWYSATAGHGKYGSSYGSSYAAPGDICPAGWRLPRGGNKSQESTNDFWRLIVTELNNGINPANYDSYSTPYYTGTEAIPISDAVRSYPNNFIYSGRERSPSIADRSTGGYYTTSTAGAEHTSLNLNFHYTDVSPGTIGINKYSGQSVRCIVGV